MRHPLARCKQCGTVLTGRDVFWENQEIGLPEFDYGDFSAYIKFPLHDCEDGCMGVIEFIGWSKDRDANHEMA